MYDLQRKIWEGWTVQDFISFLLPEIEAIMSGQSWRNPFKTKRELDCYIMINQPYYKQPIPEANQYFAERYGLL